MSLVIAASLCHKYSHLPVSSETREEYESDVRRTLTSSTNYDYPEHGQSRDDLLPPVLNISMKPSPASMSQVSMVSRVSSSAADVSTPSKLIDAPRKISVGQPVYPPVRPVQPSPPKLPAVPDAYRPIQPIAPPPSSAYQISLPDAPPLPTSSSSDPAQVALPASPSVFAANLAPVTNSVPLPPASTTSEASSAPTLPSLFPQNFSSRLSIRLPALKRSGTTTDIPSPRPSNSEPQRRYLSVNEQGGLNHSLSVGSGLSGSSNRAVENDSRQQSWEASVVGEAGGDKEEEAGLIYGFKRAASGRWFSSRWAA